MSRAALLGIADAVTIAANCKVANCTGHWWQHIVTSEQHDAVMANIRSEWRDYDAMLDREQRKRPWLGATRIPNGADAG